MLNFSLSWKCYASLLLVVFADFLFFGEETIGWVAGLYGLGLIAVIYASSVAHNTHMRSLIAALSVGLCFAMVMQPSMLAACMLLLGITSLTLIRYDQWQSNTKIWVLYVLNLLLRAPLQPLADKQSIKKLRHSGKLRRHSYQVLRSWLLPMGVGTIFLMLFFVANPIVEIWATELNTETLKGFFDLRRWLFWFAVFSVAWALLRRKLPSHMRQTQLNVQAHPILAFLFTDQAILRSLVLFNALFAMQTIMDMSYLWGGIALPHGMSYATYAQRGAYPLMCTTLLAAAFVLIIYRNEKQQPTPSSITALVYIWVGQNIFLIVSSIMRTQLYVEQYSLTYLRLSALIWMGLVACGLVLIVLRIHMRKSNLWLLNSNAALTLLTLYICCFLPLGQFIAHYNVRHSYNITGTGRVLDMHYLSNTIGVESIPALEWYTANSTNATMALRAHSQKEQLLKTLHNNQQHWRRWTWRNQWLSTAHANSATPQISGWEIQD
jgi:hypothetical protein